MESRGLERTRRLREGCRGAYPPLYCAVKCEVDHAYRIRKEQKGGKTDVGLPPVNSWLWCEVKHIPQSFFLGQPIKDHPQFYSDDAKNRRNEVSDTHDFLLPRDVFYSHPLISYRIFFTINSVHI